MKNLAVSVGSGDALDVRQFSVTEPMSSLFTISLLVMTSNPDVDFDAIMGKPAEFSLSERSSARRSWHGIVSAADQVGSEDAGLSVYTLTLVPTLWLLTQRTNYRIFQHQSELEIARRLLADWGIEPVLKIRNTYKKRKYRVQYAESDYTFFVRVLESAGISFYFQPREGGTDLVLDDAPQSNERRSTPLRYADQPTADVDYATDVLVKRSVRPGKITLRDHDYRKSPDYKLAASASHGLETEQRLEQFHYVPGAFLFGAPKSEEDRDVADDKGKTRVDEQEAAAMANRRLAADRALGRRIRFNSNAVDLRPGLVVGMGGHPRSDLREGKDLLIVDTLLSGASEGEWLVHCEGVPAEFPYHPPVETPRPSIQGVESATVVGPRGEEIHTDEFGRVRVHFHWDRESRMDDDSSCWVHVSQAWSGAGYGGTMLPRVGQEVLVSFLDGDPDRPIVTGRVYTNLQKTPYGLPANRTQSGFRSASTGGGGGYNELMMEDKQGQELLRMQAERDYAFLVKNDWSTQVRHDRVDVTHHDHSETVNGKQDVLVQGKRSVTVANDETHAVVGDRRLVVLADQAHAVRGNVEVSAVTGTSTQTAKGMSVISSEESVLLMVGPSSYILIERDKITIQSAKVEINPSA